MSADEFILCRTYIDRTKPAGGKIPLAVYYVRQSVSPVIRWTFAVFLFVLIYSVGVQRRDAFIPTLGSRETQWCPVKLMCPFICAYVSLYIWSSSSLFGEH